MDVTPLRIALESPDPGTDKNINRLRLSRLFCGVHKENELDIFNNFFRLPEVYLKQSSNCSNHCTIELVVIARNFKHPLLLHVPLNSSNWSKSF